MGSELMAVHAGVAVFYELFVKRHHWFTDGVRLLIARTDS